MPSTLTVTPTYQTVTVTDGPTLTLAASQTIAIQDGVAGVQTTHTGPLYLGSAAGASSTQYAGTGTPASSNIPYTLFQYFGQSGTIAGTTQAYSLICKYFNRTLDDSAEAGSAGCFLVDTGTPFAQTKAVVAWEGDAFVQGGNTCSSTVAGVVGWVKAQNTAQITGKACAFYASAGGAEHSGAAITNYYGLYVEDVTGSGSVSNKWGVYSNIRVQAPSYLVGVSGTVGTLSIVSGRINSDIEISATAFQSGQARLTYTDGQGYFQYPRQIADASAPSGTGARAYCRDNGAGKNQLVVRFPTGAVQVIATEP